MKVLGSCIWTVETWHSGSKLKEGESITSNHFILKEITKECIINHEWILHYYPKGRLLRAENSTFVVSCFHVETMEVTVEISLLDHKHNKVLSKKSPNTCVSCNNPIVFPEFFHTNNINESIKTGIINLLKEDKVFILCEIAIIKKNYVIEKPIINSMEFEPCETLKFDVDLDKFEKLLEDKTFSDVVFQLCEKEIHSHKIILANKSPVFFAMFEHNMKEKQLNTVEIVDIDYSVFKEMLRFIYTGKFNEINNVADKLIVAADKYCLENLKKECEIVLCRNITLHNVVACLDLAVRCNTSLFKKKVFQFILSNKKLVLSKPEFKLLVKSDSDLMLEVFAAIENS